MKLESAISVHEASLADVCSGALPVDLVRQLVVSAHVRAEKRPLGALVEEMVLEELVGRVQRTAPVNALKYHAHGPVIEVVPVDRLHGADALDAFSENSTVYQVRLWHNGLLSLPLTVPLLLSLAASTADDDSASAHVWVNRKEGTDAAHELALDLKVSGLLL